MILGRSIGLPLTPVGTDSNEAHTISMVEMVGWKRRSAVPRAMQEQTVGGYDRHLRKLRQTMADQRDLALQIIARHFLAGTRVSRPEGGYILWSNCPARSMPCGCTNWPCRSISIAPGHIFSADRPFSNFLRINRGHGHDDRFVTALETVGRLSATLVL